MCICVGIAKGIVIFVEMIYSGIINSGCSEIRTISLQRTQLKVPRYIVPIHFGSPKEDNFLTKVKKDWPQVSFIWRFHYTIDVND